MIDPHTAATAVTLANSALGAVKSALELGKKTTDLDLKQHLSDAVDNVLELKVKVYELAEENRTLRQKIEQRDTIKRDNRFGYWFKEGETEPLCPKCYEGSNAVVYLPPRHRSGGAHERVCNVCETLFFESANS